MDDTNGKVTRAWRKVELGGIQHSFLEGVFWEADVFWSQEHQVWGWKVINTRTREIHPRGFGHEGTEEVARSRAEVLVMNLDRETSTSWFRDQVRKTKLQTGVTFENTPTTKGKKA